MGFSKVYYKRQSLGSSIGYYPINVATTEAVYQLCDNNWMIHNTHFEAIYTDKIVGRGAIDFVALTFKDSTINKFKYHDVVQGSDEDNKIVKKSKEVNWKEYKKIILKQESKGSFTILPPPQIDTTKNSVHLTTKDKLVKYLITNNFKREYGIHKFPIQTTEKNKQIATYGLGLGASFRLYTSIFLKAFVASNFGISRVSLRRRSLLLSNDIVFNKTNRPATITIGTGLSTTTLKEKSLDPFRKSYNWESNIYISFEKTRKRNFFIAFSYYHPLKRDEATPFANFTNYSVGVGYVFDKN